MYTVLTKTMNSWCCKPSCCWDSRSYCVFSGRGVWGLGFGV